MFRFLLFLCTVAALAAAYGTGHYGSYGSYSREEEKMWCKKLGHYDVDSVNDGHLVRKAKFAHLERDGIHYTMITCPNDAHQYALVAKHSGSVFNIFGSSYSNTAVLAAGFKVGIVGKCDGRRTMIETTDGKKIKIKKVACIQNTNNTGILTTDPPFTEVPSTATSVPACFSCDTKNFITAILGFGADINYEDVITPGECKKAVVTCSKDPAQTCLGVWMTIYGSSNEVEILSPLPADSVSREVTCQPDGTYAIDGVVTGIAQFYCDMAMCSGS